MDVPKVLDGSYKRQAFLFCLLILLTNDSMQMKVRSFSHNCGIFL